MPDELSEQLGAFLDFYWEDEVGKAYIASIEKGQNPPKQFAVQWPAQKEAAVRTILALNAQGKDMYFCPSLFQEDAPSFERQYFKSANTRWVDMDMGAPATDLAGWEKVAKEKGIPIPSMVVKSSVEDRQHVYWRTERTTDVSALEETNRALAATLNADRSGWDAPQLLRIPGTKNYGYKNPTEMKPWYKGEPVDVSIIFGTESTANEQDFSGLVAAERQILDKLVLNEIPNIQDVIALKKWTPEFWDLFKMSKEEAAASSPDKRSGAVMRLAYLAAENNLTDEEIYSVLADACIRWDKWQDRSKSGWDKILRDTIAKARKKVGYLNGEELTMAGILGTAQEEIATAPKFIFNFQEFMDTEVNLKWHLDNLLAEEGFGVIVGQPGVGKTTLGLQMAMELAIGAERIVLWDNTTGPKKVLMLSLEMSHAPLKKFFTGMAPHYENQFSTLQRNFHVAPIGSALYLDRPEGQGLLNNIMAEYRPDILFIDSLQRVTSAPITDEQATKSLMIYLQGVRNQYHTAIYMVHHERKRSSDRAGTYSSGELSDLYGSQFIAADIDFAIALRKTGIYVTLDMYKNRLAEEHHDVQMTRDGMRFVIADISRTANEFGSGIIRPPTIDNGTDDSEGILRM